MVALFRLIVLGFLVLSLIYVILVFSERIRMRRLLRAEWEKTGQSGDRDAYVREGLVDYEQSFRRKLLLGVFIVPVAAVLVIIYVVNFM